MQDWDAALEDLNRLKDVIESNVSVFQARLPLQEMVKLNKGSFFIITETLFAIQGQVM